ncbi:MAG: shikimate dehydrogenase [Promethearchaeota archaeon]
MEIDASTKILGVIGDPIEHSMSPTMHNAALQKIATLQEVGLNYVYVAFHVKKEHLKVACEGFKALEIRGINVTIPHKVAIMDYLDEIDPIARGIGAVNTVKNENGKLIAKNTDGEGALLALKNAGFDAKGKKCLIVGAGGASRAVSFMLGTLAEEIVLIDLYPKVAETLKQNLTAFYSQSNISELLGPHAQPKFRTADLKPKSIKEELRNSHLLVNATPIGMYGSKFFGKSPLDGMSIDLREDLFVFDVVYNPLETKLLADAKSAGCRTLSGINMLINQGVIAFEWWTGKKPDPEVMLHAALIKLNVKKK